MNSLDIIMYETANQNDLLINQRCQNAILDHFDPLKPLATREERLSSSVVKELLSGATLSVDKGLW